MRIHLQKSLTAANRLPRSGAPHEVFVEDEEVSSAVEEAQTAARAALDSLLDLREVTASRISGVSLPRRIARASAASAAAVDGDIDSGSDSEGEAEPSRDLDQYWKDIEGGWGAMATYRDDTVNKWARKMQAGAWGQSSKKLTVLNQQLTKQVDAVLAHTERIPRRTRAKLGAVKLIGASLCDSDDDGARQGEYDMEAFNDTDFYTDLMRAFVESQGAAGDAAAAAHLAKSRKKQRKSKKKEVDRKASKGRKLRYTVHPKLVNFMEPTPWPTESVDIKALTSSLFQS